MHRCKPHVETEWLLIVAMSAAWYLALGTKALAGADVVEELHIEISRKDAGRQVVLSQGAREWFMLVEVTPENAVVLKQEKDHDRYMVDESETHDRPMAADEVEAVIRAYIESVKARVRKK